MSAKNKHQLDLVDLERLLNLDRAASYTEAAYRSQITESHLRRLIRKMENVAGFKLIERKRNQTLGLTSKAQAWIQSFRPLHQSLTSLSQTISNVRRINSHQHIGITPYLAFSQHLWASLQGNGTPHQSHTHIFRMSAGFDKVLKQECVGCISLAPAQQDTLESHILGHERIYCYRVKPETSADKPAPNADVVLQHPLSPRQATSILDSSRDTSSADYSFTYVANVTEALYYASSRNALFPSILLKPEIVPKNLEPYPLGNHVNLPIYLTTLRGADHAQILSDLTAKISPAA